MQFIKLYIINFSKFCRRNFVVCFLALYELIIKLSSLENLSSVLLISESGFSPLSKTILVLENKYLKLVFNIKVVLRLLLCQNAFPQS